MTKSQEKMIEFLKREIFENDNLGRPDEYEYKSFEVEELENGIISVSSTVGLKNDEGTYAAILCRIRRHIFIGLRGGLSTIITDDKGCIKRIKGDDNVLIYGKSY